MTPLPQIFTRDDHVSSLSSLASSTLLCDRLATDDDGMLSCHGAGRATIYAASCAVRLFGFGCYCKCRLCLQRLRLLTFHSASPERVEAVG